mgnify:CR=1 FL=1
MNYWKNKNITITGGSGFIGSHLAENLVNQGASIKVVDNLVMSSLNFIVFNLLKAEYAEQPDFAAALASDLSVLIQYTVLAVFGVILCASASWLAIANFVHVNGPGEADTWLWAWIIVILIGAAASAAVPIYYFNFDGSDLLQERLVVVSVLCSVIVFAVFFVFVVWGNFKLSRGLRSQ